MTRKVPAVAIETALGSAIGRRPTNQDRVYADSSMVALFDGVGGRAFGDVAATVALAEVLKRVAISGLSLGVDMAEVLRSADKAVQAVGDSIGVHIATTAVVVLFEHTNEGLMARLGWAGDSTALLVRNQGVRVLAGAVSGGPVGRRAGISNWLGNGEHLPPQHATVELMPGDTVVLLSDGITGVLESRAIGWLAASASANPRLAVEQILTAADAAGATDNCSVVIAHIRPPRQEMLLDHRQASPTLEPAPTPQPSHPVAANAPHIEDLIRTVETNAGN